MTNPFKQVHQMVFLKITNLHKKRLLIHKKAQVMYHWRNRPLISEKVQILETLMQLFKKESSLMLKYNGRHHLIKILVILVFRKIGTSKQEMLENLKMIFLQQWQKDYWTANQLHEYLKPKKVLKKMKARNFWSYQVSLLVFV